jgi:RimJ/RimL family protein N-acetyltransferase
MTDLAPIFALRLRTPRLELRLPTDDELLDLYRVAEAGIHPPEEMPFEIPWTDSLNERDFLAFHRGTRDAWSPERWTCNFGTVLDGRIIGSQTIEAAGFAETREVSTGSWLGEPFQRRGYGSEQRAAVLELAFAGLGARAATSGALIHNIASQRVSEKLGYRRTGTREIAPRGEPVLHHDYRIERDRWRCPIPVAIEGLEPALPLFGITRSD